MANTQLSKDYVEQAFSFFIKVGEFDARVAVFILPFGFSELSSTNKLAAAKLLHRATFHGFLGMPSPNFRSIIEIMLESDLGGPLNKMANEILRHEGELGPNDDDIC